MISSSAYNSGIYSFAIWQIFTPGAVSVLSSGQKTDVKTAMTDAFGANFSGGLTIYTPVAGQASQEFIGVPEASSIAVLGFNLVALFTGLSLMRKRVLRNA